MGLNWQVIINITIFIYTMLTFIQIGIEYCYVSYDDFFLDFN